MLRTSPWSSTTAAPRASRVTDTTIRSPTVKLPRCGQFPAVVSLPGGERPVTHWPNVIMIMSDRSTELNALDKVVHFYDDKVQSNYFLTRPEPHFTVVVIFDGRKSERDSNIVAFLQELTGSLRNTKPFTTLKPGSKGWTSSYLSI